MTEYYGVTRNLIKKYNKLVYEENYKNEINNESSTFNKRNGNS